jgi:hypothetical protein
MDRNNAPASPAKTAGCGAAVSDASLDETDVVGDTFALVCLQRIRLHHDQQVPEWVFASIDH